MNKIEKQKKFQQTLLNIYYPPPPTPQIQNSVEKQTVSIHQQSLNTDFISDEFNDSEEEISPDDTSDCESQKLTRAQRKRLRKKKLKEAASQRRKIIGPLLASVDGGEALEDKESYGIEDNPASDKRITSTAAQESNAAAKDKHGKLKHRRMGKRLGRSVVDHIDSEVGYQVHASVERTAM